MTVPAITPAAPGASDRAQLRKAAQGFEAMMVRQMLKAAHSDALKSDLFSSQATDTFREMQDGRFADIAASNGALGFANMIEAQLSARLGASTGSARAGGEDSSLHPEKDSPVPARPEPVEGPSATGAA